MGLRTVMSWKTYLWANGISTGLLLCSAGLALWLYAFGSEPGNGWIVLAQLVTAVGSVAISAPTWRRTRRQLEQARAGAEPPPWRPPSATPGW